MLTQAAFKAQKMKPGVGKPSKMREHDNKNGLTF